jgi:hypothetical protein
MRHENATIRQLTSHFRRRYPIHGKRDGRSPSSLGRRSIERNALNVGKPAPHLFGESRRALVECSVSRKQLLATVCPFRQRCQEVNRGGSTGDSFMVERAGLRPLGRGVERRLYFRKRQLFKQLASAPQRADVRSIELVCRRHKKIAIPLSHVGQMMRDVMDCVDEKKRANRPGEPGSSRDVVDCAERVRRRANCDDFRADIHLLLEVVPIECAGSNVHFDDAECATTFLGERLPRADIGVVIELGDHEFVARGEQPAQCPRDVECERRSVCTEDNFVRRPAKEIRNHRPSLVENRIRFRAGRIVPVRVGVVMKQIVADRFDNRLRHLRAAGTIEIRDPEASVLSLKCRETGPNVVDIWHWGIAAAGRAANNVRWTFGVLWHATYCRVIDAEWIERLSASPSGGFLAIEAQCEALRASAGLYEFVEWGCDWFIPASRERCLQFIATRVRDHAPADDNRVAAKTLGLGMFGLDQFFDVLANGALAVLIERGRIPNCFVIGERAEAGVEVIIAGIDELDRNHTAAEFAADLLMAGGVTSHAIAGVEGVAAEECVAGAFKAEVFRHLDDFEAVLCKPAAVVGFFALPLPVAEAREKSLPMKDHRGVGREYQIGEPRPGFQQRDLGTGIDDVCPQGVPLSNRHRVFCLARHVHPRIDFVVDAVVIRRAHQDVWLRTTHVFRAMTNDQISMTKCGLRMYWSLALGHWSFLFLEFLYILHERPQERLDVGHEAQSLEAAAVAELDGGRRVDVDANHFDPSRQQVTDGNRMEHGRDHEAVRHVANSGAHLALGFHYIGDDVGQWAVVADAAGEQEIDIVFHAFIHDAGCEDAFVDRGADRAATANAVDRSQMMLVSGFGNAGVDELDAEAGAEETLLDVVGGQRVAGEKFVDVAAADELTQGRAAAGVDDCGSADDECLAAPSAVGYEVASDLADKGALRFLSGDAARHEGEVATYGGAFGRNDTHAAVAHHDRHAVYDFGHWDAPGRRTCRIDHYSAIHFLVGDFDPMAVQPDFGSLVGRAVKTFGKRAVHVGVGEAAVLFRGWDSSMIGDLGEDMSHPLSVGGANFNDCIARVMSGLADRDVRDAELAAVGGDRVEHLGQNEAVDDMAGDFDLFDDGIFGSHSLVFAGGLGAAGFA